jgi:hypothetical protein
LSPPSIWQTLGIDPTRDPRQIRRAYAQRLKSSNPEDDAEGFKVLRAAYEQALAHVGRAGPIASGEAASSASAGTATTEASQAERPPAPPMSDAKTRHIAACGRLAALVGASPPPHPEALDQALEAVLSSPALDEIGIRVDTDRWLVQLIAHNQPRSDPLLDKTIARFGWNDRTIGRKDADIIRWLLQRQSDRAFLRQLEDPQSMYHWAFAALQRLPARPGLVQRLRGHDRTAEVATLLAEIRIRRPTIVANLDPAIVAAWDNYLSKPRLSAKELWVVAIAPVALLLLGVAPSIEWPSQGHMVLIEVPLAVVLSLAAGALIRLYGVAWPRWHWTRRPPACRPIWLAVGWAPAVLGLLVVSAVLPPIVPAVAAVAVLAAAVLLWVLITGRSDGGGALRVLREAVVLYAATFFWWVMIAPETAVNRHVAMSIAVVTGMIVSIAGARPLLGLWYDRLQPGGRTLGLLALLVSTAGAGGLLWLVPGHRSLASLAVAAVASLVLVSRPLAVGLIPRSAGWIHVFTLVAGAIAVAYSTHHVRLVLPAGGTWLLACVALTTGMVLAAQRSTPKVGGKT